MAKEKIPEKIGKYKIIEKVGGGGYGVVYKAFDPDIDPDCEHPFAIKVLSQVMDDESFERFRREAKIMLNLNHQNIVRFYGADIFDGKYYIVMDYIEGTTLKQLIEKESKLDLKTAIYYIMQIADALSYAHKQGFVHRDIKPSNILIEKGTNKAYVSDFGIAKAIYEPQTLKVETIDKQTVSYMTKTGFLVGTPEYMSPEQASGKKEIDQRSDIYSLGIVFYEMLTGRVPFSDSTPLSILVKHLSEVPKPPNYFNPSIPFRVNKIILKMLAKDVNKRYSSMDEVIKDLKLVKNGLPLNIRSEDTLSDKPTIYIGFPTLSQRGIENNEQLLKNIKKLFLGLFVSAAILSLFFAFRTNLFKHPNVSGVSKVSFITTPAGAEVYMNGKKIGITPINNYTISSGNFEILFRKEGYEDKKVEIKTQPNESKLYSFVLDKKSSSPPEENNTTTIKNAIVSINSDPSGCEIFINGKSLGEFTPSIVQLAPGSYSVKLVKSGYKEYSQVFSVSAGESKQISAKLVVLQEKPVNTVSYGTISVTSVPSGAKVYVNDNYMGVTPISKSLKSGTYRIRITKTGFMEYSKEVEVISGETTSLRVTLSQIPKNATLHVYTQPDGAYIFIDGTKVGTSPLYFYKISSGSHEILIKKEGYMPISKIVEIAPNSEYVLKENLSPLP